MKTTKSIVGRIDVVATEVKAQLSQEEEAINTEKKEESKKLPPSVAQESALQTSSSALQPEKSTHE